MHADGTRHSHPHHHDHTHRHDPEHGRTIELNARILAKNDAIAAQNRAWFAGREILALNLVSSPGAGKTLLLERTIQALKHELDLFVIEGDQATTADGERIRKAGAAAIQVNTGTGCHLDAAMVARSVQELRPGLGSV
ncbi:MAG TPA: GTP-binding protein, partial [Steroidobacteraceae bacterium]|nr:GTP-binding protein [Steroidobacteraceae bacterium]